MQKVCRIGTHLANGTYHEGLLANFKPNKVRLILKLEYMTNMTEHEIESHVNEDCACIEKPAKGRKK